MGFDWVTLQQLNPKLIVTRISGFGQTGPLSGKPCFDVIGQTMSGLMEITGDPDSHPTMAGTYIVDYSTGMYATIGTLGALQARERTGKGQVVDVALLDAAMSMLMTLMDKERRTWYGDQEALRVYSHMLHPYLVGEFSEAQYACLPDKRREGDVPHILHYKGPARKEWFYAA